MFYQFYELKDKISYFLPFLNDKKPILKGLKKTDERFISKIKNISKDKIQFTDYLQSLNIFTDITDNLTVSEDKNKFSFIAKDKDKNVLAINIPNIFGKGENFYANYSSKKDYNVKVVKPIILKNSLFFLKLENSKILCENRLKNKNEISLGCKNVDFGFGYPNYIFAKLQNQKFNLNIKQGYNFSKIETNIKYTCNLFYNFKYNIKILGGQILGNINNDEKFIRNKKEIDAFFNISNKLICDCKILTIYTYHELEIKNNNFRNNIENSLGAGISIPLYRDKEKPCIDISIKVPINENRCIDNYQFSYDVIF